ncbi:MAG TPA: hypothetical protein VD815_10710 [Candidatus Saccharimonadales bacterium]|nr:hypothetical protein [Candidatus Saccharimonadales bacterium]
MIENENNSYSNNFVTSKLSYSNLQPYSFSVDTSNDTMSNLSSFIGDTIAKEEFFELEEKIAESAMDDPHDSNMTTKLYTTSPLSELVTNGFNASWSHNSSNLVEIPSTAQLGMSNNISIINKIPLNDVIPNDQLYYRNEPSIAMGSDITLLVGTCYMVRDINDIQNWEYLDLREKCESIGGDMDLLYDDINGNFVWSMMNLPFETDSGRYTNNISIGISSDTNNWNMYDISAEMLDQNWTENLFDYPQISFSDKYLYISVNRFSNFTAEGATYEGPLVVRIDRNLLSSIASSIPMQYFSSDSKNRVFTFVSGVENVMYWGAHYTEPSGDILRIHEWNDNMNVINWRDRVINNWNNSDQFQCSVDIRHDWCKSSDSRITSGWINNGTIGFLWNVPSGDGFETSHIEGAVFDINNLSYLGPIYIANPSLHILYGNVYPKNNTIGIVTAYSYVENNETSYPNNLVGIGYLSNNGSVTWSMKSAVNGTNFPYANEWGDFYRVIPHSNNSDVWVATAFVLEGGVDSHHIVPYYIEFGVTP